MQWQRLHVCAFLRGCGSLRSPPFETVREHDGQHVLAEFPDWMHVTLLLGGCTTGQPGVIAWPWLAGSRRAVNLDRNVNRDGFESCLQSHKFCAVVHPEAVMKLMHRVTAWITHTHTCTAVNSSPTTSVWSCVHTLVNPNSIWPLWCMSKIEMPSYTIQQSLLSMGITITLEGSIICTLFVSVSLINLYSVALGVGIDTEAAIQYYHAIGPWCDIIAILYTFTIRYCYSILRYIAMYFSHILRFMYWETLQPPWRRKFVLDSNFRCDAREERGVVPSCGLLKQCNASKRMYRNKIKIIGLKELILRSCCAVSI